ncbi:MAG TPA: universal stress protein [Candidatus Binatia bacterium]|nr:universal stress protein [Candidatus Binatia bacterium]
MSRLFRTVLVPHDFSPQATAALRVAATLARAAKGRLLVLHAIAPVQPFVGVSPVAPAEWMPVFPGPDVVRHERQRLESLVRRTVPRRVKATSRVVVGDPFQAILDAAGGATAIVMGTLGRTGLPHLLLGSVAEKVVRHAEVPVLTVPARAARKVTGRRRS